MLNPEVCCSFSVVGNLDVLPLYFLNIQSVWIAHVVITRERIYRWARWAGGNNLSAKRVDLEKRVDPMLGFVWIFQL